MTTLFTRRPSFFARFFGPSRHRSREVLDPRNLSNHVLRDLGLLDGHVPHGTIR